MLQSREICDRGLCKWHVDLIELVLNAKYALSTHARYRSACFTASPLGYGVALTARRSAKVKLTWFRRLTITNSNWIYKHSKKLSIGVSTDQLYDMHMSRQPLQDFDLALHSVQALAIND